MIPPIVGIVLVAGAGWLGYRAIHDAEKKRVVKGKVERELDLGLCDDPDAVGAWAKVRGWNLWYVADQPVTTWKPPKAAYLAENSPLAYSVKDCGFYWWDAASSRWLEHKQADDDFAAWSSTQ